MADQSGSKLMFWLIQGQLKPHSTNIMAREKATNSRFHLNFQLSGCHVWHGQQQQCNFICWRNIHGCLCVLSNGKIQCSRTEGNFRKKKSLKQALSASYFLYASQIVLSFCGLMVIGLSVLSCFGVCFYFKLYSTQMQQMVPFLLLGIGVDDIFVIAKVQFHQKPT